MSSPQEQTSASTGSNNGPSSTAQPSAGTVAGAGLSLPNNHQGSNITIGSELIRDGNDAGCEKIISFDEVLSSKIGFGIYQIIVLLVVCLIDFVDGSEQFYMMILVQVLQVEWQLTSTEIELLGSFYYIGLFLGAIAAGVLCDWFGRKSSLVFSTIVQLITVTVTAFADTFAHMLVIRACYGFVIGMTLPIGYLMITELAPKDVRGRCLILIQSAFLLGKFYLLLVCTYFMEDLSKGNWRAIALCQTFPTLLLAIGCMTCLKESPRFLVSRQRFGDAFAIMDEVIKENHEGKREPLSAEEKAGLKAWQMDIFARTPSTKEIVYGLFKGKNLAVSWRVIFANSVNSFLTSGVMFLIPFYFHSTGQGFLQIFLATLGEVPASFIVYFLIDMPSFGRLRIINTMLFICCGIFVVMYFTRDNFLVAGLALILFSGRFVNICSVPVISESYDTVHRSMGLGISTAIGRAMGAFAPFVMYEIYTYDKWVIFILAAVLSFICFLTTLTYPMDMTNKPLDSKEKKEHDEQEHLIQKNEEEIETQLADSGVVERRKQLKENSTL